MNFCNFCLSNHNGLSPKRGDKLVNINFRVMKHVPSGTFKTLNKLINFKAKAKIVYDLLSLLLFNLDVLSPKGGKFGQ